MTANGIGVGVIGCGLIGRKRLLNLPEDCRPVAVYDVVQEAAVAASALTADAPYVAGSTAEILNDPDISIVVVATNHAGLAVTAHQVLQHGKHVLIEKPGSISAEALRPIVGLAESSGLCAHVGFNHRFHPSMLLARELIHSGTYGELLWVRGRYGHGGRIGYEKEWRADRRVSGGGELLDQGSHLIDLNRFFFGDANLVYSRLTTSFWDMEVEDNAFLVLEPMTGGTSWLHASWTEWKNTFSLEITLRTAKIDINGLGGSYGPETLTLFEMQPEMGPPPSTVHTWDKTDDSWKLEFGDFLGAISGKPSIGATVQDAFATLSVIERAYQQ